MKTHQIIYALAALIVAVIASALLEAAGVL